MANLSVDSMVEQQQQVKEHFLPQVGVRSDEQDEGQLTAGGIKQEKQQPGEETELSLSAESFVVQLNSCAETILFEPG